VDRTGIPPAAVSPANVNDVVARSMPGYREDGRMPEGWYADPEYHKAMLRWMSIEPPLGQRGEPHGSGLGEVRYVVERTVAAVHRNRRRKIRYEKREEDRYQAFLTLACIKLCWYRLDPKRQ
jgi:hypothetical protein